MSVKMNKGTFQGRQHFKNITNYNKGQGEQITEKWSYLPFQMPSHQLSR